MRWVSAATRLLLLVGLATATAAGAQQRETPDLNELLERAEETAGEAEAISEGVFGPRRSVDLAYGAYQKGQYLTAFSYALDRAEQNDATAQTLIGVLYENGLGVAQDPGLAASWYDIAARNGDPAAAFQLALLMQEGRGIPQNRGRAAELFEQAAEGGYAEAKYNLALLHIEGVHVPPDMVRAAGLMSEAAEAGLPRALYDYGIMLIEGAGVAPDIGAGADRVGRAARAGLAEAQVEYATLLYLGQGVPQDREEAARWYRRAANQGNPVAQARLAKLHAVGENVELDLQEAAMWRALARRQGLVDPELQRLLVSISEADLAAAEERARFWPGTPPEETGTPPMRSTDADAATRRAVEEALAAAEDEQGEVEGGAGDGGDPPVDATNE